MERKKSVLTCTLFLFISLAGFKLSFAQATLPENGVAPPKAAKIILNNICVVDENGKASSPQKIFIENDKFVKSFSNSNGPIQNIDAKGAWLYPSFIHIYSDYGIHAPSQDRGKYPQFLSAKKGSWYWNQAIRPEINSSEFFYPDSNLAKAYLKAGIGLVLSHSDDGISRGTGVLSFLVEDMNQAVFKNYIASFYALTKGSSPQDYPSSLMGGIALIRQYFYDIKAYSAAKKQNKEKLNLSLEAALFQANFLKVFKSEEKFDLIRIQKIIDEFSFNNTLLIGNGMEYQLDKKDILKSKNQFLAIPLKFPNAIDIKNEWDLERVAYLELKHWEMAPFNFKIAKDKWGIDQLIIFPDDNKIGDFLNDLKIVKQTGLSDQELLKALVYNPSKIIGTEKEIGKIIPGYYANAFISNGNIFSDSGKIIYQINKGNLLEYKSDQTTEAKLIISGPKLDSLIQINGKINALGFSSKEYKINHFEGVWSSLFSISSYDFSFTGYSVNNSDTLVKGFGAIDGIKSFDFVIINHSLSKKDSLNKEAKKRNFSVIPQGNYYSFRYADTDKKNYLINNITIHVSHNNEKAFIGTIKISNGVISEITKAGEPRIKESHSKDVIIDGTGLHLSAGLIDEHSHIAISRGVNEGTQSVTSEVRIGDVLNPDDINIYRQLAGGVTSSHLLHGSANAIGGQTQMIKMRWGVNSPEELKFQNWPGFIKFALGENVKQSNWGERNSVRFPQTRMGVEQVIKDSFNRALEYEKAKKENPEITAIDLELEALLEILNKERFITCHSYVQSEILMLMDLAEGFGFRINTFTHILEGYKVAQRMKEHGAAASTFADWWAYKYEVIEAIPYNAAILNKVGVLTAINSDDAEMGRRLNQEAAKALKYGKISETEALNMVTINAAKMLRIDKYTGSIEKGKDADLVIWSANPLSIEARVLYTFVDGIIYFDYNKDIEAKQNLDKEKRRIWKLMKEFGVKSGDNPPQKRAEVHYHCESMEGDWFND